MTSGKETLKLIISQVKPYKRRFIITGFLIIFLSSLVWIRPALLRRAIDVEIANGDYYGLLNVFAVIIFFLLLESILRYRTTYLANWVAQSVSLDLRSKLFKHIVGFRLRFFDKTPVGKLVTRLVSDIDGIANVFSNGLLNAIGDVLTLGVVLATMFIIDAKLTLIVIIPIPILLFASRIFQKHIKKAFSDVRNQVSKMNEFVQEQVTGMHIVQAFGRERVESEKFAQINELHKKANIDSIMAFSIFFPVVEMLSATSVALLLWLGIGGADRFNVLQMGVVNADRVFKLLQTDESINDEGTIKLEKIDGLIEFENVWFSYDDEENWVLKDLSLKIKPGSTVGFVGSTGAGKSTIINLLSRFYEFQKGSIKIDGVDIREIPLDDLRKSIGVVQQEVFLMSDTLRANVTLHDERVSDEEVWAAAEAIGAADFIKKHEENLDLQARERGAMLSVGQRQLIAFMRSYVASPSILILDEATASIDSESENMIQEATKRITEGRTSLIVAHRLSTIKNADKIFVIENGFVVEEGTHHELVDLGGVYKELTTARSSDNQ